MIGECDNNWDLAENIFINIHCNYSENIKQTKNATKFIKDENGNVCAI